MAAPPPAGNQLATTEPEKEETYKYSGCYKVTNPEKQRFKSRPLALTPFKCFHFCNQKRKEGAKWFLLRSPNNKNLAPCTCLPYLEKQAVDEALCSAKCEGDPSAKCGGPLYESVYVMVSCEKLPPTAVELNNQRQMEKSLKKLGLKK
jgi:hypothetical protein